MPSVFRLSASQNTISPSIFSGKPGQSSVRVSSLPSPTPLSADEGAELASMIESSLPMTASSASSTLFSANGSPSPLSTPTQSAGFLYQPGPEISPARADAATTSGDAKYA